MSWVSAADEILFTALAVLALFFPVAAATQQDCATHAARLRILSVLCYVAALFTKETAVAVLPILILSALLWQEHDAVRLSDLKFRNGPARGLRLTGYYLLGTVFYFAVRSAVLHGSGLETGKHSWKEVAFTSPSLILFYGRKLLWPTGLSFFYVNPILSTFTWSFWVGVTALVTAVGLIVWCTLRGRRAAAIGIALVLLPVLPAVNALRIYEQGNLTHDRYLYLPSIGLCLVAALAIEHAFATWPRARTVLTTALFALYAWHAYLTVIQQRYYRSDEVSLFRGLEIAPDNALVMESLGKVYLKQGDEESALTWFRKAQLAAPADPHVTLELARGLFQTGHYDDAEKILDELLQRSSLQDGQRALGFLYLANLQIQKGNLDQAERCLHRLERMNPKYPGLHRTLGVVFQTEQRIAEAEAEYAKEFEITGDEEARRQAVGLGRFLRASPNGNK